LIQAGGVIDHKDGMSLTALHHACVRGKIACVQVLLKHGADPNSKDKVEYCYRLCCFSSDNKGIMYLFSCAPTFDLAPEIEYQKNCPNTALI